MKKILYAVMAMMLISSAASAQNSRRKNSKVPPQKSSFRQKMDTIGNSLGTTYDEFTEGVNRDYEAFRDKVNKEYADFMEKGWELFKMEAPTPHPIEKQKPPVIFDQQKDKKEHKEQAIKAKIVPIDLRVKPQPKPFVPIKEVPVTVPQPVKEEPVKQDPVKVDPIKMQKPPVTTPPTITPPVITVADPTYSTFTFYGTPMKVRWGKADKLKLQGNDERAFAALFRELAGREYNNLIRDCLQLRIEYNLCDWAYFNMLRALSEAACGANTNEAAFLQGYLFQQSGYSMRYAFEPTSHKLHVLARANSSVFDYKSIYADGHLFYLFEKSNATQLRVCNMKYQGEQELALDVVPLPLFKELLTAERVIKSRSYGVETKARLNKNLIDFFDSYPTSFKNGDFMTRWAYYANTPLSKEVKEQIYPQLKAKISTANTQLMAANMLLNWVQTGLVYEYDDKVWGGDRAFFAEESLHYPFCDCEDRSILFSHLVRDLLGLDVVLVYYPGHLATAVAFTEDVRGDYIMANGRKFVVSDGTYINAPVGRTMPGMDNAEAKVILLKRNLDK